MFHILFSPSWLLYTWVRVPGTGTRSVRTADVYRGLEATYPTTMEFGLDEVEYLVHRVGVRGVRMDDAKIKAIVEWPTPANRKALRSSLGLAGYYRRFIQRFASRVMPMSDLLKETTA